MRTIRRLIGAFLYWVWFGPRDRRTVDEARRAAGLAFAKGEDPTREDLGILRMGTGRSFADLNRERMALGHLTPEYDAVVDPHGLVAPTTIDEALQDALGTRERFTTRAPRTGTTLETDEVGGDE